MKTNSKFLFIFSPIFLILTFVAIENLTKNYQIHQSQFRTSKTTKIYAKLEQTSNKLTLYNQCKIRKFPPKNFKLAVIPLLSFPGSGNTWLRHLIEISTGFYTGSIYRDGAIYKSGMLGEFQPVLSGKTIVVKSHLSKQVNSKILFDHLQENSRNTSKQNYCIFLIRNPQDAILAEIKRMYSNDHVAELESVFHYLGLKNSLRPGGMDNLDHPGVPSFAEELREVYARLALTYTRTYRERKKFCDQNILEVYYEDLKRSQKSLTEVLKKIYDFIYLANSKVYPESLENSSYSLNNLLKFRPECLKLSSLTIGNFKRKHSKESIEIQQQIIEVLKNQFVMADFYNFHRYKAQRSENIGMAYFLRGLKVLDIFTYEWTLLRI